MRKRPRERWGWPHSLQAPMDLGLIKVRTDQTAYSWQITKIKESLIYMVYKECHCTFWSQEMKGKDPVLSPLLRPAQQTSHIPPGMGTHSVIDLISTGENTAFNCSTKYPSQLGGLGVFQLWARRESYPQPPVHEPKSALVTTIMRTANTPLRIPERKDWWLLFQTKGSRALV